MTNTTRKRVRLSLALVLLAGAAGAATLDLPRGAQQTAFQVSGADSYRLPTGPWADGYLPVRTVEGKIAREAWRLDGRGITTLQMLAPLRDQLRDQGYDILLDCADTDCGGFDFRFATEILPAPAVYVDIADFRFLSAVKPAGESGSEQHVSVLVSRTDAASYIQIIRVGADISAAPVRTTRTIAPVAAATAPPGEVAVELDTNGVSILTDLTFASGSSSLGDGPFASLQAVADYLAAHPNRKIMFVGHTDATGSLDGNVALSRRRAQSVVDYVTDRLGVSSTRVSAQGVGYLSPIASSLTEEGRERNRRVEAVLISTE